MVFGKTKGVKANDDEYKQELVIKGIWRWIA